MKRFSLIAIAAAGVLSASASACPAYTSGNQTDGNSPPVRQLLHSTATSTCTPREYWLPAQCTSDRYVSGAGRTGQGKKEHGETTETCTPRTYWLPAHCQ
jgi:hypothetical protein